MREKVIGKVVENARKESEENDCLSRYLNAFPFWKSQCSRENFPVLTISVIVMKFHLEENLEPSFSILNHYWLKWHFRLPISNEKIVKSLENCSSLEEMKENSLSMRKTDFWKRQILINVWYNSEMCLSTSLIDLDRHRHRYEDGGVNNSVHSRIIQQGRWDHETLKC